MDLSFTPEERTFRAEMRDFFRTQIPAEIREKAGKGEHVSKHDLQTTQRAMNAAGIATPHWPVQYGGKDWTSVQSYIWLDEMQTASVPAPPAFNTSMVGPVIAQFGNPGGRFIYPMTPTPGMERLHYSYQKFDTTSHQRRIKALDVVFNASGQMLDYRAASVTNPFAPVVPAASGGGLLFLPMAHAGGGRH